MGGRRHAPRGSRVAIARGPASIRSCGKGCLGDAAGPVVGIVLNVMLPTFFSVGCPDEAPILDAGRVLFGEERPGTDLRSLWSVGVDCSDAREIVVGTSRAVLRPT